MKVNDMVRLTPTAIKNFYGTYKLIDCYQFQGDVRPKDFVSFVNEYVGFVKGFGRIAEINVCSGETTMRVDFCGPTGWDYAYFGKEDLRRAK